MVPLIDLFGAPIYSITVLTAHVGEETDANP